jgi:hypothetical protein
VLLRGDRKQHQTLTEHHPTRSTAEIHHETS